MKGLIKQYWDEVPCGTKGINYPEGSLAYYEAINRNRDKWDYFIPEYAQFDRWKGKKVLEVGCGVGSDLIRFAKAGAVVTGIDLSPKSVDLTKKRLSLYNYAGNAIEADAERIPDKDNCFDFLWSWGILHHTPNISQAIREIYRVTKPGGEICIMLYHKYSLVSLQMYLLFGLLRFRPFLSLDTIMARYHESFGTKAYTTNEVRKMFAAFEPLDIDVVITPYDLRYRRDKYLPLWLGKLIPQRLGWNIIVRGQKP